MTQAQIRLQLGDLTQNYSGQAVIANGPLSEARSNKISLMPTYFRLQEKYADKFGPQTLVLIQIGTFYEFYHYDPNNCIKPEDRISSSDPDRIYNKPIGCALDAGAALDIVVTSRNKNRPYSVDNPSMVGFPMVAYENKKKILLAHGFVLVRIDQIDRDDPNDPEIIRLSGNQKPRKVIEVISTSTDLDAPPPVVGTNKIVSIYVEFQKGHKSFEDFVLTCGVSSIDVVTGICRVGELYSKPDDKMVAVQEIRRFLLSEQPREIVVNVNKIPISYLVEEIDPMYYPYSKFLREHLDLDKYDNVIIHYNRVDDQYLKLKYQEQFLQQIYFNQPSTHIKTMVVGQILSRLNLERLEYGRVSFLIVLQYCKEHNEDTIREVKQPQVGQIDTNHHLILTYNAIQQLNITPTHGVAVKKKEIRSLLQVLDFTSTRMGYRMLQDRLVNPMINEDVLELSYQMIFECGNLEVEGSKLMDSLRSKLREIPDVERYHRKLRLQTITPRELAILSRTYHKITDTYSEVYHHGGAALSLVLSMAQATQFNHFLQVLNKTFDIDKLERCSPFQDDKKRNMLDFNQCPLNPGIHAELDQMVTNMQQYRVQLEQIANYLNQFITGTRSKKVECRFNLKIDKKTKETIGFMMTTSEASAKKLAKSASQIDTSICGQIQYTRVPGSFKIFSSRIEELSKAFEMTTTLIRIKLWELFQKLVQDCSELTSPTNIAGDSPNFHTSLITMISTVDFSCCGAKAAQKNNYNRPVIVRAEGGSFMSMQDIRHPIIEKVIDHPYITNNVYLGFSSCQTEEGQDDTSPNQSRLRPQGYLLYGANSTGKSSLAKAMGLNIIMAQAGLYTAGQLTYRPYKRLITRLSGHDDIIKGMSSFMIEMEELRIILNNADSRTLVLGDELCRGTESKSGTGLTLATLEKLTQFQSTFIFSTHMHHLVGTTELAALGSKLKVCHLSVRFDTELSELVIERKLKDGSGSTTYGIEVAKSMGLNKDFIERANQIRKDMDAGQSQILSTQKSHYNTKLYMAPCAICNKSENLHTHHIKEQNLADDNGFIGHEHKNVRSNLISLCQSCHQKVHKEGLTLSLKPTVGGVKMVLV